jgi:hypothetical protein
MRKCHRCDIDMIEGFDIKVEGGGYGIKVAKGKGISAKRMEKPKVAICPKCGEISLYMENIEGIFK